MRKLLLTIVVMYASCGFAQQHDSLIQALQKTDAPEKQFKIWGLLADHYLYTGQTDSQRISGNKLLQLALDNDLDSLTGDAYAYISAYFSNTGDYEQALEYLFKGLTIADHYKIPRSLCFINKEIGFVYKSLKNYAEALKYLRRAQEQLNKNTNGDPGNANRVYAHMAECFINLQQYDSALRYVQLANENANKITDPYSFARTLYIFASLYDHKGEKDLAESYYKRSITFSDSAKLGLPLTTASLNYSNFLIEHDVTLAKYYALKGLETASASRSKPRMIEASSALKNIYKKTGNTDSAFYYSELKDHYIDSVFNEKISIQLQNLSFTQQISEQEKKDRETEEEKERHHNLQLIAIFVSIITIFILFILISRTILVNAKLISFLGVIVLLLVFEFINLMIHPKLEKATNDNPVVMLIILVLIASMLIPLHHKIEKEIITRLIKKNNKLKLAAAKKTMEELQSPASNKE